MKIEFILYEDDYLMLHLFEASKSGRFRKKDRQRDITSFLVSIFAGLLFIQIEGIIFATIFTVILIIITLYHILNRKNRIYNEYKYTIHDAYKNRSGTISYLEWNRDFITDTTSVSECRYNSSQIEAINEISSHIFIRIKSGERFIIPKSKIGDPELTSTNLQELASFLHVPYNIQLQWKWR